MLVDSRKIDGENMEKVPPLKKCNKPWMKRNISKEMSIGKR